MSAWDTPPDPRNDAGLGPAPDYLSDEKLAKLLARLMRGDELEYVGPLPEAEAPGEPPPAPEDTPELMSRRIVAIAIIAPAVLMLALALLLALAG